LRWTSPAGFAWEVAPANTDQPADFRGRDQETSLGAPLPDDAQLHPNRVKFRGYHLDADGVTFRYDFELTDHSQASFVERLTTDSDDTRARIVRDLEINTPKASTVTLHVADLTAPPRVFAVGGDANGVEAKSNSDTALDAHSLLLCIGEAGPVFYRLTGQKDGTLWRVIDRDGQFTVCVQTSTALPATPAPSTDDSAAPRAHLMLETLLPADGVSVEQMLNALYPVEPK
jgi:hypothetical protein